MEQFIITALAVIRVLAPTSCLSALLAVASSVLSLHYQDPPQLRVLHLFNYLQILKSLTLLTLLAQFRPAIAHSKKFLRGFLFPHLLLNTFLNLSGQLVPLILLAYCETLLPILVFCQHGKRFYVEAKLFCALLRGGKRHNLSSTIRKRISSFDTDAADSSDATTDPGGRSLTPA